MKKSLYQYAILRHVKKGKDEYETSILYPITLTLASSHDEVKLIAARNIPEDVTIDQVEVVVRPF